MKPLVLIEMWFGAWPSWIDLHLETCRHNPEVDWIIFTDQPSPQNCPPNVRFIRFTLADFVARIGERVGEDLSMVHQAYKLCDLRPALGEAFSEEIAGYKSFGFNDLDVFFGNIRQFYDDALLDRFDVISTHRRRVSGHLAVFRNIPKIRGAFRRIRHWPERMQDARNRSVDESALYRVFSSHIPPIRLLRTLTWRTKFTERYSTIEISPWRDGTQNWPQEWHWQDGRLTNNQDGPSVEYLYLHVMAWQSDRWRKNHGPAPWPLLPGGPVKITLEQARTSGFTISPAGLTASRLS